MAGLLISGVIFALALAATEAAEPTREWPAKVELVNITISPSPPSAPVTAAKLAGGSLPVKPSEHVAASLPTPRPAFSATQTQPAQVTFQVSADVHTSVVTDSTWENLAGCESDHTWEIATGNNFWGGLQETMENWLHYGGLDYAPRPDLATRKQQITIAVKILTEQGWVAWPRCSLKLGLRD